MQELKQNNDSIKRRSVYDQSDKMKIIEEQYHKIKFVWRRCTKME